MKILISGLLFFALQSYATTPDCPASVSQDSVPLEQDVALQMIDVLQRNDSGSFKKLDTKALFLSVTHPYRTTREERDRIVAVFNEIGFGVSDYKAARSPKVKGHKDALERLDRGWRALSQIVGVPDNRIITRGQVNAVNLALMNSPGRR